MTGITFLISKISEHENTWYVVQDYETFTINIYIPFPKRSADLKDLMETLESIRPAGTVFLIKPMNFWQRWFFNRRMRTTG